jgi:hypothetical protein
MRSIVSKAFPEGRNDGYLTEVPKWSNPAVKGIGYAFLASSHLLG